MINGTSSPLLSVDFDYVRQMMFDYSSVVLEAGKEYLVEARLLSIVQEREMNSLGELVEALRKKSSNPVHRTVASIRSDHGTLLHDFGRRSECIVSGFFSY